MDAWKKVKRGVAKMLNMNTIDTPTSPKMEDESFLEWMGIKRAKKSEPLQEVTYFTCLKMMSETIAKMPWKFYQKTKNGIKEPEETDISRL